MKISRQFLTRQAVKLFYFKIKMLSKKYHSDDVSWTYLKPKKSEIAIIY